MAEGHAEGHAALHEFLGKETAGLPNWAWGLVVVAGIAAAIVLPKFLGGSKNSTGQSDQGGSDQTPPTTGSGIGLAVDPTTGLPYAVEGLVPSGANAGNTQTVTPAPTPTPTPAPTPTPTPTPTPAPKDTGKKWYTIPVWPGTHTLADVASKFGISKDRIYQLNPQIDKNAHLKQGWTVRIA